MTDGYQPNNNPNQAPPPNAGMPTTDQMIGDTTMVATSFIKDPVGAIRNAWDNKKIGVAMIVAAVIVATQLLYSILSLWGARFGYILGSWLRYSVRELVLLALLALLGMLLVKGHCNSGYIGALSGVGTAALLPVAGFVINTVFLLVAKILPFWLFEHLNGIVASIVGTPLNLAMFLLLALTIRRKTGKADDFTLARNTILLAIAYYVGSYLIYQIIW